MTTPRRRRKTHRNLSIDTDLEFRIRDFCHQTHRHIPTTIRAILDLFFAEGDEVAERRLSRRVWGDHGGHPSPRAIDDDPQLQPLRSKV